MSITVDTNIVVYAAERTGDGRGLLARRIMAALRIRQCAVSLQVCGETFRVLHHKKKWSGQDARTFATDLMAGYHSFAATAPSVRRAMDIAAQGALSFWDANLVSAAEAAGCTHLLTEDMHPGHRFGRLEIVNPFSGDALSERAREILSL